MPKNNKPKRKPMKPVRMWAVVFGNGKILGPTDLDPILFENRNHALTCCSIYCEVVQVEIREVRPRKVKRGK
jgi:hypothetical protein